MQRPEGVIISSVTGVAEVATAPCGCQEPTPVLLQEPYVLATMETFFQHHCFASLIGLYFFVVVVAHSGLFHVYFLDAFY